VNVGGDLGAGSKVAAASLRAPVAAARPEASAAARALSVKARILLWDFERGSLAYDLLILFLVLLLVAVPASWWADPMIPRPRP
jgi:hypothetical protein